MRKYMRIICLAATLTIVLWAGALAQTFGESDSLGSVITRTWYDQPINPDQYLVRPGERLEVVFVNTKLPNLLLTVNAESRIVDRNLGVLDLRGLTLTQVRQRLREPLSRLYNAQEIVISLTAAYPVSIQVTGAVNRPGCYVGYTSHRVSDIIDSAGGITVDGSLRHIVFSGGPSGIPVDLDRAQYLGDRSADPCLYAGDHIYVPSRTAAPVAVLGSVNTPREIELLGDETLDTLVALAGGRKGATDKPLSAVVLNDPARDIGAPGAARPGDRIVIGGVSDDRVVVTGSVKLPGQVAIAATATLHDALQAAGGVVTGANIDRIAVFRRTLPEGQLLAGLTRFPLYLFGTQPESVILRPGDSVVVPSKVGFVMVSGAVNRPGTYSYLESSPVSHYLQLAGGAEPDAKVNVFDRVTGMTLPGSTGTVVLDGDNIVIEPAEERAR
jgi:protein involved in polysaccharide export with SLBB domain